MLRFCVGLLVPLAVMLAQEGPLRVIAFGAHPDDCDIRAAGTAAKFRALGAAVKFVSVTNGDAGHQSMGGGALAKRRRGEAEESGRRLGITYEVLDNHDGELLPTIAVIATQAGYLIGGLIVVETLFHYQGVGGLIYAAAKSHDFPMLEAGILTVGTIYVLSSLAADLLSVRLNPLLRFGARS